MNSTQPIVSICIPAYNSEKYIAATIDSLLHQTYTHIEIIVADDGSTDGTVAFLQTITDERFKFISLPNRGAAAARNSAYELSKGDYIKFMDSDDLMTLDSIASQLEKIVNHPGCISSAKWGRFYLADQSDFKLSPEKVWKDLPGIDWLIESLIETGANMMQPGIFLIPRRIIDKVGPWNESLSLIDDFEYMVRVLCNSDFVFFCNNAVLQYRSGNVKSLSGQTSLSHMQSAFNSLKLGLYHILLKRNDERSRLTCANTYKRWSFMFYPHHLDLFKKLEVEIKKLGGSNTSIIGSSAFLFLSKLFGWKYAKRIKLFLKGDKF